MLNKMGHIFHTTVLRKYKCFTLAEVVIALAIIGVITTFAIPKLINNYQSAARNAVFRETLGTISNTLVNGIRVNQVSVGNAYSFFASQLNAIKSCGNSEAQGCWNTALQGDFSGRQAYPGFILPNGAVIVGFNSACCNFGSEVFQGLLMDINGASSPNLLGQDIITLTLCYFGNCSARIGGSGQKTAGTIGPISSDWDGSTKSTLLWNELFNQQ